MDAGFGQPIIPAPLKWTKIAAGDYAFGAWRVHRDSADSHGDTVWLLYRNGVSAGMAISLADAKESIAQKESK